MQSQNKIARLFTKSSYFYWDMRQLHASVNTMEPLAAVSMWRGSGIAAD